MKIAILLDNISHKNGVKFHVTNLMKYFSNKNQNISIKIIATSAHTISSKKDVKLIDSYNIKLPNYGLFPLFINRTQLKKEIENYCPDIVDIQTPGPVGLIGLKIATKLNIPAIYFHHADFTEMLSIIYDNLIASRLLRTISSLYFNWFFNKVKVIVTYNNMLPKFTEKKIYRLSYTYPYLPIVPNIFDENILKIRSDILSQKGKNKAIVYFGRFSKEKNLNSLLVLSELMTDIKVFLIGEGTSIENANSYNNVIILDFIKFNELSQLLDLFDLFVLPSFTESFSRSTFEALYYGLPVLISRNAGILSLDGAEKVIYTFDPNSIYDLKAKAEHILMNDCKIEKKKRIEFINGFNETTYYETLITIWKNVLYS